MPIEVAGVVARLGFRVDDDGANRFERKVRDLRSDARRDVVVPLKGDLQRRDLDLYEKKLNEIRAKVRRREDFKAQLGADYDPRAFNAYERDSRRIVKQTDDNVKSAGRLRTAFGNIWVSGAGAFAAAGGGYAIYTGLKSIVAASGEAEVSAGKLRTQVEALGRDYDKHAEKIDRVIQKTSLLAGIDDEDLADAFTNIARTSGSVQDGLEGIAIAADIARARGMDVAKAGDLVGKVYAGNFTALKRYGIVLDENATKEEAIRAIQEKFAGQARTYGRTQQGAIERLQVAWENLRETLGEKLAPTITDLANKAARFITQMSEGRGEGGRFVDKMREVWEEIKRVGGVLVDAGGWLKDHIKLVGLAAGAWVSYKAAVKTAAAVQAASGLIGGITGRGRGRGGAGTAAAGVAGGAVLGGPVGVGVAAVGIGLTAAQINALSRGEKATEALAKMTAHLGRLARTSSRDYEALRDVIDKVSKGQPLTRRENDLWTKSLRDMGVTGKTAVDKLLDSWKDLRRESERTFRADEMREYRKHVRTTVDTSIAQWKRLEKDGGGSLKDIRERTRTTGRFIRQQLPEDTAEARKAVSDNFRRARGAIRDAMAAGKVDTKEGSRLIREYMIRGLTALGLTRSQATAKLDTGTIQTRRGPQADAARGGRMGSDGRVYRDGGGWIGAPGQVGMDTVPAMLAPGEAVLNRHQQAVIEGLLGGGFLDRLFSRVSTPHYMAKGGIVPVPGFPGESAASSVVPKILQIARQFGLTLTDAFGAGHKSPGHTQFGTAADFAGPDRNMDRAVAALVRAGYVVGYDGRFGSRDWPGHGPAAGQGGSNAHLHVELGGGGGALASDVKIPRMVTGLRGGLGALVQRGLDRVRGGAKDAAMARLSSMVETPVGGGGGGGWGKAALARLWRAVNGGLGDPNLMAAIALAESGGRAGIVNSIGAGGLWQIHPPVAGYLDPRRNAALAGGKLRTQGLRAWEAYTNGAYRAFLSRGGLVRRFARGGRAGFEASQGATNVAAAGAEHRAAQGFALRSRRRTLAHRIDDYENYMGAVERTRSRYSIAERVYNRIDDGSLVNEETGEVNTEAVQRKADAILQMILLAGQIVHYLEEARKVARRVVRSYKAIVTRLRSSLKHAKKKDRSGIKAQLDDAIAGRDEYIGIVGDLDLDIVNARMDVEDLSAERNTILGTSATPKETEAETTSETTEGPPTPEQIAQGVAAQMAAFSEARKSLFSTFGSNYTLAGGALVPGDVTGQAAGLSHFGSLTSGAGGGLGAGVGGNTINQTNIFPTPPPDPHIFARLTLYDLEAAP